MRRIEFTIVLILVVAALEIYTYRALKGQWGAYKKWLKKTLQITHLTLMVLGAIGFIVLLTLGTTLPSWLINFFFAFVIFNLIVKFILTFFLLFDDLIRGFRWGLRKLKRKPKNIAQENGISRADFIVKTGLIAAAVPAVSLPLGMVVGPYKYTLHKPTVNLPNLPSAFEGLRIVQLSDIHAGSFYNKEAVNKGIDLLLAQKPDIIFFTGDLVNNNATEMENYKEVFSRLSAPLGVYSILGNHDYGDYQQWDSEEAKAANLEELKSIHAQMGWQLLLNEHVYIKKNGQEIALIGVENWGAGFHQKGDLVKAYQGCNAPVKLLLSHDPTHWDEQVRKSFTDIDITFSGHTHGAQMGIETGGFKWSPISLRYDKWAGLYQEKNQYLYVNRGYGFLGYPGRIGIWPEITVMTLTNTTV